VAPRSKKCTSKPVDSRRREVTTMNSFRVQFALDKITAEKFNKVRDKPALIAEALKWYYTYGKESLDRLNRIESLLSTGVDIRVREEYKTEENKNDNIDDIFDNFTI
jgi:hypothetical protein